MSLAIWNVNHRVGKTRYRPEAASAAVSLGADVVVLTEYFPRQHHQQFCDTLAQHGWEQQCMSSADEDPANRVFIAARIPMHGISVEHPSFDPHLSANVLAVALPTVDMQLVSLRIPAWNKNGTELRSRTWQWIERLAQQLAETNSVIGGDFNVDLLSPGRLVRDHLGRMSKTGWHVAEPAGGASFFGKSDRRSRIDHVIGTQTCAFKNVRYVTRAGEFELAGGSDAISDHAALVLDVATAQ